MKWYLIGGATTSLYIDDQASPRSLATMDIDCTIDLTSSISLEALEKKLSKLGFKHSFEEGDPLCRYLFAGIEVDIMPADVKILGFTNQWYKDGIKNRVPISLPDGQIVHVFSPPYFIASKIEAMKSRGGADLRFSHDLEDIVLVLSGCSSILSQMKNAHPSVLRYLREEFSKLLKNPYFEEAIDVFVEDKNELKLRRKKVIDLILSINSLFK